MVNNSGMADSNIAYSAAGPKRFEVDGMGKSEEHSLKDQIAAAKYNAVPANGFFGISMRKLKAGGSVLPHESPT